MGKVKDDVAIYIKRDIDKVRTKTNMYIQEHGVERIKHCWVEIAQNMLDECNNPNSNGDRIDINYDIATDIVSVEDNGRGFPSSLSLNIFCETLQSGSKFFRDQGGISNGEFGVGLCVVNGLSELFTITSWKDDENRFHEITYNEGKMVKEIDRPLHKSEKRHGSKIRFKISKEFVGNNDSLPYDDCIKWLDTQMHFPMENKKLKVTFDVYDGMKLIESHKFKPKPFTGLLDRIVTESESKYAPTITLSGDKKVPETINGKKMIKDLHLDVAITYVNDTNTYYDTYCNYGVTIDGGTHLDAVNKAFCNYMQSKTKSTMSDSQKDKTPITWDDVKSGLCCVISLTTSAQVSFQGNAKTKIGNDELAPYIIDIVREELDKLSKEDPKTIDMLCKIIKLNAKARVEMQEMKTATQTEKMNSFKDLLLDKYTPANNHGKGQYRALFLCEGDSAGGSIRNGGNPATDAILRLRGVTVNAAKCKNVAELMKNREVSTLVNVLRCGIGKNFNLNNLWFDRIYISTDADTDGDGISDQLITIFYLFFPEIIKAGRLYKLLNPLYHLDDGTEHGLYVKNKEELVKVYHSKIVKRYKIKLSKKDDWFTKDELKEFLFDTYDYRASLIRAAESMGNTDKFLVETIVAYLVLLANVKEGDTLSDIKNNSKLMNKYMSLITKKYKEIYLDKDGNLRGIVDGKYRKVKLANRLLKKTSDLLPVFRKYGYKIIVKEKDFEPVEMTIGEFLDNCMKLQSKVISRYKGLTIN